MGPPHNPSGRSNGLGADPFESFVQLAVPQLVPSFVGCGVVDTAQRDLREVEIAPLRDVDSPDDRLAEAFPGIDPMQLNALRETVEGFISSIREEVSRSFTIGGEGVVREEERLQIRYGASRRSLEFGPIVWVECRRLETECYVLPRFREGMCGDGWLGSGEGELPERFFDGPARLILQFDPERDEIVRCIPFVSSLCEAEAESHLMVALRTGEHAEASYLIAQYHDLVIEQAIRAGELSADATQIERSAYLAERHYPARIETSCSTDGGRSYAVAYPERDGRPSFVDRVSLAEVSPWGLHVVSVTTSRP